MKVVVNRCYGGFSISLQAAEFMAARGNKGAIAEIEKYQARLANPNEFEAKHGVSWYGYDFDRDDVDLIAAVESLGDAADGKYAYLEVVEIPDDIDWEIDEYDGMERVDEKHRSW